MEPLVTTAGQRSVEELLDAVERGRRVVVRAEYPGTAREVTLRWDGRAYYCDTPRRRHRHESRETMRACIENRRHGID